LAADGPAWSLNGEHREERLASIHDLPEGHALETMAGIEQGPHASLDAALAEIERHTRGICRRSTGEDQS
jgi:hypothetical protein